MRLLPTQHLLLLRPLLLLRVHLSLPVRAGAQGLGGGEAAGAERARGSRTAGAEGQARGDGAVARPAPPMEGTDITSRCTLVARCGDEVLIMARQVRERHTEIEARELADRGEQIGSFPERFHDAAVEARDAEETTLEPVEDKVAAPA